MFLSSCIKLPAKYFHHINETEPFSVFVNGTVLQFCIKRTVAMMAQRGVSLKSILTCYEKNKMIFFFIWAVFDFLTINISWFLLNIKQHPSPISRKPQTVLNVRMAWIVCIVLFFVSQVCLPHVQGDCSYILTPRATGAARPSPAGPECKKCRPGIYNRSHDLVPGRSHDQSSRLLKIKIWKYNKREKKKHVAIYIVYFILHVFLTYDVTRPTLERR